MTTGIVVIAAVAATLLGRLPHQQSSFFSGGPDGPPRLSRQQLLEIGRLLDETTERQENLAHLFSEGQVRNLEVLQTRFSDAIDTLNRQLGTVTASLNDAAVTDSRKHKPGTGKQPERHLHRFRSVSAN